ncbi:MAG: hypothetical protein AAGI68_12195 [Planctomycetota bacterium]
MPDTLSIPMVLPPESEGDRFEVEIDGVVLGDRLVLGRSLAIAGGISGRPAWGKGPATVWGGGSWGGRAAAVWGEGVWGFGDWGRLWRVLELTTRSQFAAGDYTVRVRRVDAVGNAGAWSVTATYRHRPQPAAPASVRAEGGRLVWTHPTAPTTPAAP